MSEVIFFVTRVPAGYEVRLNDGPFLEFMLFVMAMLVGVSLVVRWLDR